MNKSLHIICFDVPYPANYGGVIDVMYRIKALHDCGLNIILHCFQYGHRGQSEELQAYCTQIYYYPRKKWGLSIKKPYIVSSRNDASLLENLLQDDAPILFEAVHSTLLLTHPKISHRIKLVRMHNIEHDYYASLAKSERNLIKKAYYTLESWMLSQYENKLKAAQYILAISPKDELDLRAIFGDKVKLLPAFHGNKEIAIEPGKSDYCFYHGKLSVAENNVAALFLVNEVFAHIPYQLIIAGDGASAELKKAVAKFNHIQLLESVNADEITQYIKKAHINILPTFQATGIKLKLVNVLFNGRFVLVNSQMVAETGLSAATIIADNPITMQEKIAELFTLEFDAIAIDERKTILAGQFDNMKHAKAFISLLD